MGPFASGDLSKANFLLCLQVKCGSTPGLRFFLEGEEILRVFARLHSVENVVSGGCRSVLPEWW